MLKNMKIGARIGLSSTLLLLVVLAVITPTVLNKIDAIVSEAEQNALSRQHQALTSELQNEAKKAETLAMLVAQLPEAQDAFAAGDRKRLEQMFMPGFKVLK
jgi:methyl-accepting chemotaxis protein